MIDWDAYTHRLKTDGATRKDRILNRTRQKILNEVGKHPGCDEVLVNDVPQFIFTKRTDDPIKISFNTLPGEVMALGSVIYWQDRHWLVTESLSSDRMTYYGSFELCNRQITWQNPNTREIIKRWSTIKKPYYSNMDSSAMLTISSREFKVQMPSDFESNQIDIDKRFMLETIGDSPKVYKCTSVDVNSKRYDVEGELAGFLILNIEQDQYDPEKDNVELGVCNYLEPFDVLQPTKSGWCIVEPSSEYLNPGGLPISINARFFDADGIPIVGEKPIWSVHAQPEVEEALIQQMHEDGILRLALQENVELIGQDIEVVASNEAGTISNSINIKVVNML